MIRRRNLIISLTLVGLTAPGLAQEATPDAEVDSIARRYIQLNFQQRDIVGAGELLAEGVTFTDPTGEVFGGPLAKGITGRQAVHDLQTQWGIVESAFNVEAAFACTEFACQIGTLDYQVKDQSPVVGIPFAMILKIVNGEIVERLDLGDYTMVAAGGVVPERHLRKTADAYLSAYLEMRFDDLADMLAEDATFHDPTASMMGGGEMHEGRDKIVEAFRGAFGVVHEFELKPVRAFAFQHHAVFMGLCRYVLTGEAIEVAQETVEFTDIPLMVVLRIEDGKVVEHRDYADYDVFHAQLQKLVAPHE